MKIRMSGWASLCLVLCFLAGQALAQESDWIRQLECASDSRDRAEAAEALGAYRWPSVFVALTEHLQVEEDSNVIRETIASLKEVRGAVLDEVLKEGGIDLLMSLHPDNQNEGKRRIDSLNVLDIWEIFDLASSWLDYFGFALVVEPKRSQTVDVFLNLMLEFVVDRDPKDGSPVNPRFPRLRRWVGEYFAIMTRAEKEIFIHLGASSPVIAQLLRVILENEYSYKEGRGWIRSARYRISDVEEASVAAWVEALAQAYLATTDTQILERAGILGSIQALSGQTISGQARPGQALRGSRYLDVIPLIELVDAQEYKDPVTRQLLYGRLKQLEGDTDTILSDPDHFWGLALDLANASAEAEGRMNLRRRVRESAKYLEGEVNRVSQRLQTLSHQGRYKKSLEAGKSKK